MPSFAHRLIAWQQCHGRHELPWQGTRDPYRVWVSEIMLQQTQVGTVVPYYQRFLMRFPNIASLAAAEEDEVLQHWSGLGYYSRARNLYRAASIVVAEHGAVFPRDFDAILALPGIGRSTAAAISAFSFGERRAILDGNVKRVFARHFGIEGFPGDKQVENHMWQQAELLLPASGIEAYTQALMDLGATLCTRGHPACSTCPLSDSCVALAQGRVQQLPTSRPRKALPERETVMLLIQHQGEILLEKRPPVGIWGGLWSLPEIGASDDPVRLCRDRYGLSVASTTELPVFTHTFTHFKLHITPKLLRMTQAQTAANESGQLWITPEDALDGAIPAPIRKLLTQFLVT